MQPCKADLNPSNFPPRHDRRFPLMSTKTLLYLLFGLRDRAFHGSDGGDITTVGVAVEERKGRDDVRRLEQVPRGDGLL